MHQHFGSRLEPQHDTGASVATTLTPVQQVLLVLRRQYLTIAACIILAIGLGFAYLWVLRPTYTAVATMMIDARHGGIQQKSVLGDPDLTDSAWIDSQLGMLMLQRQRIGEAIASKFAADPDPDLLYDGNFFSELKVRITKLLGNSPPENSLQDESKAERMQQIASAIANGLEVKRVGLSYLVTIKFSSHSKKLTAKIADAAADAYVVAELRGKEHDLRQASGWLQERYEALRDQATAADRAVIDFKEKHHIITSGDKLFNEQELAQINTALSAARQKAAEQQAKLDQIKSLIKTQEETGTFDSTVSEAILNPVVTRYRTRYLDVIAQETHLSRLLGPKHHAVINLKSEAKQLQKSIQDELKRIAEGVQSDLQTARREEAELRKQQSLILSKVPIDAQIALRSLEARAQSYRTFYDQFFLRYTESIQQESSPIPVTRVISYASAPFPSDPSAVRVLSLFALVGGIMGFGGGLLREVLDHVFRTRLEVESVLKRECLAMVPLVHPTNGMLSGPVPRPLQLIANRSADGEPQHVFRNTDIGAAALIHQPFSEFVEAIRALKLAADLREPGSRPKVIGFTSSLCGEGKSTLAAATAGLAGLTGGKAILIDCDLRSTHLSLSLTPNAKEGLLEVLSGARPLASVVWKDLDTGIDFLPAANASEMRHTMQVLRGDSLKQLFEELRKKYEYIVVDLPPLLPVVDVRATTELVDFYFFVIEWGRTRVDIINEALSGALEVYENVAGFVLNKVDLNVISRYRGYQQRYKRHAYFESRKGKKLRRAYTRTRN